uniref:Myb_DNA-bind_5 domain-containing protein n=1 Tax=Caenorhabditis tropicalis TaxID=1561998 RepID=A0A1I7TQ41_9PELO
MTGKMSRKALMETPITAQSSIGHILRAQFALQNQLPEDKPKTIGFNEAENMKLYELYSTRREEYHSTRPSGQRNEDVPMDTLAKEWATEITAMGFAERTPAQIKQRIRDMRKFSRKHAHKLGITNMSAGQEIDRYAEFSWAEPKRRSRGPVPDWMSGLAEIMMNEQDIKNEDADSASDIMEATYGPKAKRLKLERTEMQLQQLQLHLNMKQRELKQEKEKEEFQEEQELRSSTNTPQMQFQVRQQRDVSPETMLIEKKLALANAKLHTEHLKQQALRLEIASYQRQLQLYDEQQNQNSLASEIASSSSPTDFLSMKLNGFMKSESP